jgi:hypothetical protein
MKTTLRRILTGLALAAGLALATAPAASAGTYTYYGAESYNPSYGSSAFTQFYAAHSVYIVSIQNNYVNCPGLNGAHVTWCGTVGNNTGHAQAGVNYTAGGQSFWMRMDVYAPASSPTGHLYCTTRGDAGSHFVTSCDGVAR